MKQAIIALLICVTVCTAQDSLIASLLNHTTLKGDLKFNTTKGLDLGYNASLRFDNKYVSFEVANLISKFMAKYKNDTNEFDYDGDLALTHSGHNATAHVKGALGYENDADASMDKTTNVTRAHITRTVRHKNTWKVQADDASAEGDHHGALNASLILSQKGNKIALHEDVLASGTVNGSTSYNGSNVGNFTYDRAGLVSLDEGIVINPRDRKKHNPNATFIGKLGFLDSGNLTWNDQTSGVNRRGQAAFAGESYINFSKHENNTFSRVVSGEAGVFQYQNQVFRNGKKLGDTFVKGKAGYAQAVNSLQYDNGTLEVAAANYGAADEQWAAFPTRANRQSNTYIVMAEPDSHEEEEGSENYKGGKPSSGAIAGKWKGGIVYRSGADNDHGGQGVDLKSGLFYDINGVDTISKKPWIIQGNRTADTHWHVSPNGTDIENITVSTDTDNNFLRKVLKSNKELEGFLRGN